MAEELEVAPATTFDIPSDTEFSVEQAAEALSAARDKPAEETNEASEAGRRLASFKAKKAERAQAAPEEAPAPELADEANSDPETAPAETTDEDEPAEVPPIDPPQSWTKDAKDQWQSLPREAQEIIAQREQERDSAIRRSQNEAAEKLKGLTAKEQQVEQARQQYESALPMLLQTLQQSQQGEFADIKTMADVEKLAREDWPRYALWDAQQKKIAAVAQEVKSSQDRQTAEFQTKWNEFAAKQDELLIDRMPQLKNSAEASKVGERAFKHLEDVGFTRDEIGKSWDGQLGISVRDARLQQIIAEWTSFKEAKASIAKPTAKPVKPVQRPGAAPDKSAGNLSRVKEAEERLSNARGMSAMDAAVELLNARRAANG